MEERWSWEVKREKERDGLLEEKGSSEVGEKMEGKKREEGV